MFFKLRDYNRAENKGRPISTECEQAKALIHTADLSIADLKREFGSGFKKDGDLHEWIERFNQARHEVGNQLYEARSKIPPKVIMRFHTTKGQYPQAFTMRVDNTAVMGELFVQAEVFFYLRSLTVNGEQVRKYFDWIDTKQPMIEAIRLKRHDIIDIKLDRVSPKQLRTEVLPKIRKFLKTIES